MDRVYLFVTIAAVFFSSVISAQSIPTVLVQYDGAGNRVLRKIEVICPNCPEPGPPGTSSSQAPEEGLFRRAGTGDNPADNGVFSLYPNPFDEDLIIQNTGWTENIRGTIKVFDITGKMIMEHEVHAATEVLHFTNMASGTYMIYYYSDEQLQKIWKVTKNSTR